MIIHPTKVLQEVICSYDINEDDFFTSSKNIASEARQAAVYILTKYCLYTGGQANNFFDKGPKSKWAYKCIYAMEDKIRKKPALINRIDEIYKRACARV